jgi:two-component system sensor histidine kinase KdpD
MLSEARERRAAGVDLVVGVVETHNRKETEALLDGLEILPRVEIGYRGVRLEEFDLDRALARRPELILVDELAHTNAPGSRHAKRWQDVEELLNAGISVYTTVNVQHLESLNDVVAQITGVVVRETVPDRVLEGADAIELIDLPADELLQRLKEGKVYIAQQAERAGGNFFRKGNLIALRELALRRTADRVDAQMESYRRDHAIAKPWPANERILVGVSSSPLASRLVRAASRMAERLGGAWIVVYVETPGELRRPEQERDRAVQTLRLAEQLGAETVTLSGANAASELLSYARDRNISTIIIGKPERPRWQDRFSGSVADDLIRRSGVIDVYVLSGEAGDTELPRPAELGASSPWRAYLWALAIVIVASAVSLLLDRAAFSEANLIMLYLLGVLVVALSGGRGPAGLAALLGVLAFNFLFVEPRLSFAVSDTRYLLTFAVMFLVGLVVSTLVVRFRWQAEAAHARERRTSALYALSRALASVRGFENLLSAAVWHIHEVFDSQVVVLLPTKRGTL